jgi:hypothetical protein
MIEVDRDNDANLVVSTSSVNSRAVTQVNAITAINGTTITVRNPWFYDFSVGNPKIHNTFFGIVSLSGIENLKMDHAGFSGNYNLSWQYCDRCWLKGIESTNATAYHVGPILGTLNIEVRDSFIHDGGVGPNNSGLDCYGNYLYGGNSSAKIENNIFTKDFPAIELNNSCSGFYIGYNYEYGTSSQGGYLVTWTYDDGHTPFQIMNLYEGNIGEMWGVDGFFGGSGYGTVLRNYFTGYNPYGAAGDAIQLKRLAYYYNLIGNVLGSTNQKPASYSTGCGGPNIYELGYPNIGNCDTTDETGYPVAGMTYPDGKVASTLLRWGNYDYFNKAAQFSASEIPSGVAVPNDQTIPTSYYYSAIPSWWPSAVAWPPIGPDVTGGNGDTSGHVNKTPAQACWETRNLLAGGSFSASACYAGGTSTSPVLQVTPATNIAASGNQGGPFSPPSFSYTLSATTGSVNYTVTNVPNWLSASTTSGTLTSGMPVTLTFTVNADANSLAATTYSATINFTNSDTGQGSQTRTASLTVNAASTSALQVTPATNIAASGTQGGPFSPSSFSYSVSSTTDTVNYSITNVPDWLTVSSSSGTATTSPQTITFSVNLSANNLSPNTYISGINFNNTTNNQGNKSITATLTVASGGGNYTVMVSTSPTGDGTVTGAGTFAAGDSDTVTAAPDSGYLFVNWTQNGTTVSKRASYTFTVNSNISLVANFAPCRRSGPRHLLSLQVLFEERIDNRADGGHGVAPVDSGAAYRPNRSPAASSSSTVMVR